MELYKCEGALTATSTIETEFVSCFEVKSHSYFISRLIIVSSISTLLKLYSNNSAVVFMIKNNKSRVELSILTLNT